MVLPSGKYSIDLPNRQIIWTIWGELANQDLAEYKGLGPAVPPRSEISSLGPIELASSIKYSRDERHHTGTEPLKEEIGCGDKARAPLSPRR